MGPAPTLALVPASRGDSAVAGTSATQVESASVVLTGTNASTTAWTAAHTIRGTWLDITAGTGRGNGTVRWSRNAAGLAVGTYVDTLTVTAAGAAGSPATLLDTLRILAPPGPPVRLAFVSQPANALPGGLLGRVEVEALDSAGKRSPSPVVTITLAITTGTGASGAQLGGTVSRSTTEGSATFEDLSVSAPDKSFTLTATAPGLSSSTSAAFAVIALSADPSRISAGESHTCALTATGAAYCWGLNDIGQLGDGTTTTRPSPVPVSGGLTFSAITVGLGFTCGLTLGGAVYCWGANFNGQLGDGTTASRGTPAPVSGGLVFRTVDAGGWHVCGIATDGTSYCWGANPFGQLGDSTASDRTVPVRVTGGLAFQSLSAGYYHTCGVAGGGGAYCWGQDSIGQLGDGGGGDHSSPTPVTGGVKFLVVSAGALHTCGLAATGTANCWGWNGWGQLGGAPASSSSPQSVAAGSFQMISAGDYNTCALTLDRRATCWGANDLGQLGRPDATDNVHQVPALVTTAERFQAVSVGGNHVCAVSTAGGARCWGWNYSGQLGIGQIADKTSPSPVAGGISFQGVSAGAYSACGASSGGAYCWGYNDRAQLGDNTRLSRASPTPVAGDLVLHGISVGENRACGLDPSSVAYCWGDNANLVPRQVMVSGPHSWGVSQFEYVTVGVDKTCGRSTLREAGYGTVYCWYPNFVGGFHWTGGLGCLSWWRPCTNLALDYPAMSAGSEHACALDANGTAYCWGGNHSGQLGNGTTDSALDMPAAVEGGVTFTAISTGGTGFQCYRDVVVNGQAGGILGEVCGQTCALSGTAYCWGANDAGQVGDGSAGTDRLSPVPVAGGITFASISTGAIHTCALTVTGQAYCWGANFRGQLGDGTYTDRTAPVPVVGGLTFKTISAGGGHTCALGTDNRAYCWGWNLVGQLGDGTAFARSPAPVIGGITFGTETAPAPRPLRLRGETIVPAIRSPRAPDRIGVRPNPADARASSRIGCSAAPRETAAIRNRELIDVRRLLARRGC